MPVQASHQIKVFADGARPVTADGAHQIGAKEAKRSRNNRQHVSLRPGLPANQERRGDTSMTWITSMLLRGKRTRRRVPPWISEPFNTRMIRPQQRRVSDPPEWEP